MLILYPEDPDTPIGFTPLTVSRYFPTRLWKFAEFMHGIKFDYQWASVSNA